MDSKKIIKKYIMPGGFVRFGAVILGIVLAVTLVMGLITLTADPGDPVAYDTTTTPTGTMAYIDVVGVSNWLYQYDDAVYYTVEDVYGDLYTVRLKDSQLKELSAQEKYWNRVSDAVPAPEAYRLVGLVQNAGSDVRESLAQSWDITTADYEAYFGMTFLNATTTAGAQNSALWFVGALISGLLALLCLIFQLRASSMAKKCLGVLEERCLLDKAAQQLENPAEQLIIGKNRGILTQDFVFGKGTGAVVAYSDILWAYKQDAKRNFMPVNSYLMVATSWMGAQGVVDLNAPDKTGCIGDALAVIATRNPRAMLGFTNENRSAYKAALRATK